MLVRLEVRNTESAPLKTYIGIEFKEKKRKQIYPEFPGKFGIIMKTVLQIKPKPKNSEKATSTTLIGIILNEKVKKKYLPEFTGYSENTEGLVIRNE